MDWNYWLETGNMAEISSQEANKHLKKPASLGRLEKPVIKQETGLKNGLENRKLAGKTSA